MRWGTTLLLSLCAILLGVWIYMFERHGDTTEQRRETLRRVAAVEPSDVIGLRVHHDNQVIVCVRTNGQWRLNSPVDAPADAGRVEALVEELTMLRKGNIITPENRGKPAWTEPYGLDRPRAEITVQTERGSITVQFGRDTPLGGNLYAAVEGYEDIFVTGTNILTTLPPSLTEWRDRRLFHGLPIDVRRFDIQRRDGVLQLARQESGAWIIEKPVIARAASGAVQAWLDRLFEIRIEDFVADSIAAASLYGLDDPDAQVTVFLAPRNLETSVRLGRAVDNRPGSMYASIAGRDHVIAVPGALQGLASIPVEDLRDRRLVPVDPRRIRFFRVDDDERFVKLQAAEDGTWEVLEPKRYPANNEATVTRIDTLAGARIEAFISPGDADMAKLGLAPPAFRIRMSVNEPAHSLPVLSEPSTLTNVSAAGSLTDEDFIISIGVPPGTGGVYAVVSGESGIYALGTNLLSAISVRPLDYRHDTVLALSPTDIRGLRLKTAGGEHVIERTSAGFVSAMTNRVGQTEAIGQVLSLLQNLKAGTFTAEDADSLTPYGLEEPAGSLVISLRGEAGLGKTLVFGGTDQATGGTYAMVKGVDVVFTLDPASFAILTQPLTTPMTLPEASPVPAALTP